MAPSVRMVKMVPMEPKEQMGLKVQLDLLALVNLARTVLMVQMAMTVQQDL